MGSWYDWTQVPGSLRVLVFGWGEVSLRPRDLPSMSLRRGMCTWPPSAKRATVSPEGKGRSWVWPAVLLVFEFGCMMWIVAGSSEEPAEGVSGSYWRRSLRKDTRDRGNSGESLYKLTHDDPVNHWNDVLDVCRMVWIILTMICNDSKYWFTENEN